MAKQELIEDIIAKKAFDQVERFNDLLDQSATNLTKNITASKLLEKALNGAKSIGDVTKLTDQLAKANAKLAQAQANATNTSKQAKTAADLLAAAEQKLIDKATATVNNEKAGSYKQLEAQMKLLTLEYKKMSEAERNSARGTDLNKKIDDLNTDLKALDATMGNHQRNVGNYASAWNPLSNSINQLTREMPAFANSMQTGFMAISNNIPALFDAINGIRAQNKALATEGQPTTSVLKQLAGAMFSWGTALSIGVTVLTVYGKDLAEFVATCFKGNQAMDAFIIKKKEMNEAFQNGIASTSKEIGQLNLLYSATQNQTLSIEDRKIATDKLQELYPSYFKNLSDEAILAGNAADAYNDVNKALQNKAMFEAFSGQITEIAKLMAPLQMELNGIDDKIKGIRKSNEITNKQGYTVTIGSTIDKVSLLELDVDRQKVAAKMAPLQRQMNEISKNASKYINAMDFGSKEKVEKEAKAKKEKTTSTSEADKEQKEKEERLTAEYNATYDMRKQLFESDANFAKQTIDNEKSTLEEKLIAEGDFVVAKQNLNSIALDKAIREAEGNQTIIDAVIKEHLVIQNDILKQHEIDKKAIIDKSNDEIFKSQIKHIDEVGVEMDAKNAQAIEALQQQYLDGTITRAEYEKQIKAIAHKGAIERLEIQLNEAEKALEIANISGDQQAEAQKKINAIRKDLMNEKVKEKNEQGNPFGDLGGKLEAYKKYQDAILEIATTISNAVYATEMARLDALDKRRKESFDLEKEAIEGSYMTKKEKDKALAILNADNLAKEKRIAKERNDAERKKAITDKASAVLTIGLNTAIAIAKSIADSPLTFGLPWSAVLAALGAAQIAAVLAKPLPQYAKGRKGGKAEFAEVNEQGAELVQLADGSSYIPNKGKRGITFLPSGASVIPHHELMKSTSHTYKPMQGMSTSTYDYDRIVEAQHESTKTIKKAIENNQSKINVYGDGNFQMYVQNSLR